MNATVVE